jgi:hypothetical protein
VERRIDERALGDDVNVARLLLFFPERFAKLIDRQHFTGVIGMFPLHSLLEKCNVRLAIRRLGAEHFVSAGTPLRRARHALGLERLQLSNFSLKFLMAEYIRAKGFWHTSTLPHLAGFQKVFR